jgi:hypothetical protein
MALACFGLTSRAEARGCKRSGAACNLSTNCCSGLCYGGVCVGCIPSGLPCGGNSECCSGICQHYNDFRKLCA